jgi:hypothetical protein
MTRIDRARTLLAAGASVGALFAPIAVEAERRARRGGDGDRADHGIRDYWDRAGNGGEATASANGGSFVFGSISDATVSAQETSDDEVATERRGNNRNDNRNNDNSRNDGRDDDANDDYPVGGRAGDAASRLREIADKLTGRDNRDGGNNSGGDDTDTNIAYDPETGAFGYDNGNVAYVRDADGSTFIQTGNITFESGSGASLDGGTTGGGGGGGGTGGGGGNNNGGEGFTS